VIVLDSRDRQTAAMGDLPVTEVQTGDKIVIDPAER
jgi:hypothetical protein